MSSKYGHWPVANASQPATGFQTFKERREISILGSQFSVLREAQQVLVDSMFTRTTVFKGNRIGDQSLSMLIRDEGVLIVHELK